MRFVAALVLLPLALGACGNTGLRDIRSTAKGPDEFMVQPSKPLQQPDSYNALPVPTPGQANLTDRNAVAEGVLAFGGTPQSNATGIPASDAALVQQASRMGVTANIRQELAETDAVHADQDRADRSLRPSLQTPDPGCPPRGRALASGRCTHALRPSGRVTLAELQFC